MRGCTSAAVPCCAASEPNTFIAERMTQAGSAQLSQIVKKTGPSVCRLLPAKV